MRQCLLTLPLICAAVLLGPTGAALGGEPLLLDGQHGEYRLGPTLEILEDPDAQLDIGEVTREPYASRFSPSGQAIPNYGFTRSAYWIRLRLHNTAPQASLWLLEQHFANTHYLDLYRPGTDGQGFRQQAAGNLRPYESRVFPHPRIIFPLTLAAGEEQTLYLRLQNGASSTIDLRLWRPQAFAAADRSESLWMGMLYGMLAILLGYNLFLWLSLRDPSYLWLALFLAAILSALAFYDGYAQRLFSAHLIPWSRFGVPVSLILTILAMFAFLRSFLPPPGPSSWRARLHTAHVVLWGGILLLLPFLPYTLLMKIITILGLICILFTLTWAILAWREGQPSAPLFLGGWGIFLLSILLVMSVRLGWVQPNVFSENNPIRFALVWLALAMSLGLAERIHYLQREGERTSRALRDSEEQRRLAMLAGGVGTWSWDLATNRILWSQETKEIFGVTPGGFLGTYAAYRELIHPDDVVGLERTFQVALEEDVPFSIEHRIIHGDGEPRWVACYGEIIRDAHGQPSGMHGTVQDISERVQREQQARRTEEAIEHIAAGVSAQTGEAFFRELVLHIARLFDADYVFIGLLDEDTPDTVHTTACCAHGEIVGNISYSLADTPCANVVAQEACAYPSGVRERFPKDHLLVEMNVDSYTGTPLFDSQGRPLGLLVALDSQPMTESARIKAILQIFAARASAELERLKTERDLIETQQRLSLHVQQTPLGAIEWNTDFEVTAWNPAAEHIFGYRREEALGRHAAGLIAPAEERAYIDNIWRDLLNQKGGNRSCNDNLTKDGSTIKCEWYHTPLVTEAGEVIGVASLVDDVTERMHAQTELTQHRDHLEELVAKRTSKVQDQARIIDQVHDAVVSTDLTGHVTSWNQGAAHLFGYPREEALGRHIAFVHPPEEQDSVQQTLVALKANGRLEKEIRLQRNTGEVFIAHLSLSMHHDTNGQPQGMIGILRDISERKRVETELEKQHRALEATNAELEAFSHAVSHDLRAPLRSLMGFSQALLEDYSDTLDATGVDFIHRLRNATQRMSERVDSLLSLSRLSRGELRRKTLDLSALAREVAQSLQDGDPQRRVEWDIASHVTARGDQKLLHAVLDNLLGNAWKYTAKTPAAKIAFGTVEEQDETVYFVRDNGVGFDMQYADNLFGAFQRLHSEEEFSGSGVGLATVARIIHRHGGRIRATAEVGQGAEFRFTLS